MKHKSWLLTVVGAFILAGSPPAFGAPRQVQLLAFGAPPEPSVAAAPRQRSVARAMLMNWNAIPDQTTKLESAQPDQSAFLRMPTIRVPSWMRQRAQLAAVPIVPLLPSAWCALQPYRPSGIMGRSSEERRRLLYPLVQEAACAVGLPIGLMDAMLIQESRYNPFALSPKGAFGLGQIMPGTARQLNVNRYDLRGNLAGAARYLRAHLDRFGRVDLALAAYNAGPGRVSVGAGIPRIVETRNYVSTILRNWRFLDSH